MANNNYTTNTSASSGVSHIANSPYHTPYTTTTGGYAATGGYTTTTITGSTSYSLDSLSTKIRFVFEENGKLFTTPFLEWSCIPGIGDVVRICSTVPPAGEEIPAYYVASIDWVIGAGPFYKSAVPSITIQLKPLGDMSSSAHNKLRKELIIKRVLEALL